jgi:phenylpropionate dioxygenase-like ring-hydroxylating dioxygenase large terminal subunit
MNLDKWHLLCHISELQEDKSYISVKILDKEIVCLRQDGELQVFINCCPHKGSRLVSDSCGFWEGKCPYHGLQFKNLKPVNAEALGFSKKSIERLALNEVSNDRCGDFIFFNLSASPKISLKKQLGTVLNDHIFKISNQIDKLLDHNEYDYECRWEVAIENALEPLHLPEIHSNSLNLLDLDEGEIVTDEGGLVFDHQIQNQRYKKSLNILKPKISDQSFPSTYHSTYIYPYGFISSTFGLSFSIQTFFPSNEKFKTNFSSKIFSVKLAKEEHSFLFTSFFDSSIKTNRQVFKEDYLATKNTVKIENHLTGPLAGSEEKIKWFRRKIREN